MTVRHRITQLFDLAIVCIAEIGNRAFNALNPSPEGRHTIP